MRRAWADVPRPLTYELANIAMANGTTLVAAATARLTGEPIDVKMAQSQGRLLAPSITRTPHICI